MSEEQLVWPSAPEAQILSLLLSHGALYGLALVKASAGELKRAGIYVQLGRLQAKGLVTSRRDEGSNDYVGIARRLYEITAQGERALRAWVAANRAWRDGGA